MRLMGHGARQMQHLARVHDNLLPGFVTHKEPERPFQHVGELLVRVRVLRDDTAFLQVHMREHELVTGDQATRKLLVQLFAGHRVPAIPGGCSFGVHGDNATGRAYVAPRRPLALSLAPSIVRAVSPYSTSGHDYRVT